MRNSLKSSKILYSKVMVSGLISLGALTMLAGCNGGKNQPNIELVQNMMDQASIKSQGWDHKDDKVQMRVPPEGTVSRERAPYKYAGDPLGAEANLKNPFEATPENLAMGQKFYNIYCNVCHGDTGMGDGPVAVKMAVKPPSLMSEKVRGFKDGRIFHIITEGQGVMGSYASQLQDNDGAKRWAIVNYVRSLQKKSNEVKQ